MNKDDLLQPNNPKFKEVYGYDPIKQAKDKEFKKRKDESYRKAALEEKYYNKYRVGKNSFRKGEEYRTIKREVLND